LFKTLGTTNASTAPDYYQSVLQLYPGYLLFYGSREENRQVKPLIGWLAGMGLLLMGLVR